MAAIDLERRREHVRALLSTLVKELTSHRDDRLRTAEIDPTRLDKIADMAAAAAFSKVSGAFPLPLFQAVEFTPDLLQSFMLRDKDQERGLYTRPLMTQPVANETNFWRDVINEKVAEVVLYDMVQTAPKHEVRADTPETYWKVLRDEAAQIEQVGGTPILLVRNDIFPRWLSDWRWGRVFSRSAPRPPDMRIWQSDQRGIDGYLFNMNAIATFSAPVLSTRSYLLPAEMLKRVEFTKYPSERPLDVRFEENDPPDLRGTLIFEFRRSVTLGNGRVLVLNFGSDGTPEVD